MILVHSYLDNSIRVCLVRSSYPHSTIVNGNKWSSNWNGNINPTMEIIPTHHTPGMVDQYMDKIDKAYLLLWLACSLGPNGEDWGRSTEPHWATGHMRSFLFDASAMHIIVHTKLRSSVWSATILWTNNWLLSLAVGLWLIYRLCASCLSYSHFSYSIDALYQLTFIS